MQTTPTAAPSPFAREASPLGVRRWVPGLNTLLDYQTAWIAKDVVAGVALTAILIPVGMGYAEASGLPPIQGLYASIIPLLVYAIFGPSRILVLGPDSSLAAIILATVAPLAAGNHERAVGLAGMLAILSGTMSIAAGLCRFGFVTDLISKPIRYGYLNGIAITVLAGQLPKLFGFRAPADSLLAEAGGLLRGIAEGKTNSTALLIGASCLLVILACKRWLPRFPGVLVAVGGATLVSWIFDLHATTGISVVGSLPQGLPGFRIPAVSLQDIGALAAGAAAIALVCSADMSLLSRVFAIRGGYRVDNNQELIALGAANVAAGLFQGFSVSASASRTPVAESAGARTQLTGVAGAVTIALLLTLGPSLLKDLPTAALAAVVISACLTLFEWTALLRLFQLRFSEFSVSILCFLGVILVGVIPGIFFSVAMALLLFIWRAWRPYSAVLGRVDGLKGYHDVSRHHEARRIPGLVLFRWDAPLFFANAGVFRDRVLEAVSQSPTPVKWVVVAAEPVTDVDTTAADELAELDADLHSAGIELCFAEMKGPAKDRLIRYGLFTKLGQENFHRTLGQAVDTYLKTHDVEWHDWKE